MGGGRDLSCSFVPWRSIFLWTACTTYNARRVERNVSDILKCKGVCFWWFYFISKHTVTVIYAVLIRQLVICPCLYEPVIKWPAATIHMDGARSRRRICCRELGSC